MNWKKIFREGVAKIFSPEKPASSVPRITVAQALRSDGLKVANDFRKAMNSYGGR